MATLSRSSLLEILACVQNSPEHVNRDIMTFAGFLNDEKLTDHVLSCFRQLSETSRSRCMAIAARIAVDAEQAAA